MQGRSSHLSPLQLMPSLAIEQKHLQLLVLSIIQTTNFLLLFFCFCVEKKSVKLVRHDFWVVANSLLFLDYSQVSNKRACSFFDFGVFAISACTFSCNKRKFAPLLLTFFHVIHKKICPSCSSFRYLRVLKTES